MRFDGPPEWLKMLLFYSPVLAFVGLVMLAAWGLYALLT